MCSSNNSATTSFFWFSFSWVFVSAPSNSFIRLSSAVLFLFLLEGDAADAVLKLINSDFTGTVNLGSGKKCSLKEMTNIIEKVSGKKIISEDKQVSGPMKFVTDISKLQKVIDWEPKFSLLLKIIRTT